MGAGDSLVAGLANAFSQNKSPEIALKQAVACGAGTARHPGTQLFSLEELTSLADKINITTLDI